MAITTFYFIFAFFLVVAWVKKQYHQYQFRQFSTQNGCQSAPDSSSKYPLSIDRLWKVIKLAKAHGDFMEELLMPMFKQHGWTFTTTTLGKTNVITADPENVKATLLSKFDHYVVEPDRINVFGALVGRAIFTVDGAEWKHSRALFKRQLTRGELTDMNPAEDGIRDILAVFQHNTKTGERWTSNIDLQPLFKNFTLDLGTEIFFGANVKSQLAEIPGISDVKNIAMEEASKAAAEAAGRQWTFSHALEEANDYLTDRSRMQGLARMAKTPERESAVRYLQAFVSNLVDRHFDGSNPDSKHMKTSLVEGLSSEIEDPVKIREEALFALVASRDTTSTLLDWSFLMMAKFPEKLEKLRESILQAFGTTHGEITPRMLRNCHYLQWFLNETFRLRPAAPMNARIAAQDTTLPIGGGSDGKSPVAIQKGTKITVSMYAMHRRPDIWGEDVLDFRPERWEDIKHADWKFLPFSGGPRTCPGKEFAMAEAGLVIVRLLQNFDRIEPVDDLTKIHQKVTAVLEPPNGVKLRLRRASEAE